MLTVFTESTKAFSSIVSIATSFLACVSLNSYSDTLPIDDIDQWLKQPSSVTNESHPITYASAEFSTHFNSPSYTTIVTDKKINEYGFQETYEKVAKANKEKLLRKISEQLKISLFSAEGNKSKHRIFFNSLKQELVGKSIFGNANIEIRVSEKQAEAHFRYKF
jgi:hypothetical protein